MDVKYFTSTVDVNNGYSANIDATVSTLSGEVKIAISVCSSEGSPKSLNNCMLLLAEEIGMTLLDAESIDQRSEFV